MSDEETARVLLERLGRLEVVPPAGEEREEKLARMARAVEISLIRARSQRTARRRAWVAATTLGAAAGVALMFWQRGLTGPASHQPSVLATTGAVELRSTVGSRTEVGHAGMTLEPEAELGTAPGASAEVELASGAVVAIDAKTRVRLPADARATLAERLELAEGRISLRVPKLVNGHTLSVVTPDSTVTVRGTRFSVAVNATGAHAGTSVAVEQGRVEVRSAGRSAWLSAGESWTSEPTAISSAAQAAPPSGVANRRAAFREQPPKQRGAAKPRRRVCSPKSKARLPKRTRCSSRRCAKRAPGASTRRSRISSACNVTTRALR